MKTNRKRLALALTFFVLSIPILIVVQLVFSLSTLTRFIPFFPYHYVYDLTNDADRKIADIIDAVDMWAREVKSEIPSREG